MKLIYVLNSFSESEASHFSHIGNLLLELDRNGCDIVLIIEKPSAYPDLSSTSIRIIGLRSRLAIFRHIELFLLMLHLIRSGYKKSFYRITAVACIIGSLAHNILGGESYLWQSGTTYEWDWNKPLTLGKIRWLCFSYIPNSLARSLATFFVTGPEQMVDYYHQVVGVPLHKIKLLYNDIDISRFSLKSSVQLFDDQSLLNNPNPQRICLLIVHRFSPVRRTNIYLKPLLQALRKRMTSSQWNLVIIGDGNELKDAIAIAQSTGTSSNVTFMGKVANKYLPEIYAQADIFLQPSYTEGFPRVMLEAMAAGLPIVSTDAGGSSQLVGPRQRYYIVDKNKPDLFALKTIELMNTRKNWAYLKEENISEVKRFSTESVAQMYMHTIFS